VSVYGMAQRRRDAAMMDAPITHRKKVCVPDMAHRRRNAAMMDVPIRSYKEVSA